MMPRASGHRLPADFIWGVSASGYQSEGGDVDSNWDRYNRDNADQDPYGRSIDFRHRYREDVALAKSLGVNTFRIGINWARVEPHDGEFDTAELAYYDDLVAALKEAGIAPMICLDHFVYPGWIADRGAWTSQETMTRFVRFSEMIARRYHRDVKLWLTFNEPAFFVLIEAKYRKLKWRGIRQMRRHLIGAHRQIHDLIHAIDGNARVSSNFVWCGRGMRGRLLQRFTDWLFLNGVRDKMDFIAFDYYYGGISRELLDGRPWECDPDPAGLHHALKKLTRRYPKRPILIAENGMPTLNAQARTDGVRREDALRDCIYWMEKALAEGVPVIGYLYWSLTDNFEWGHYGPRFGLYSIDVINDPTLRRVPTAAVDVYREIIRKGGVADGYTPVLD